MYNLFKPSNSNNNNWNLFKTYFQTAWFYLLFLGVLPYLIIFFEKQYNIQSFSAFQTLGIILFCMFTSLGLYSGYIMSWFGKGTPLPMDCAQKLVLKGPYKYVRNPMAIAGIGQAFSIGLYFGSYSILFYAISGAFLWHLFIRPSEEEDLLERFGKEYSDYKLETWCWFPIQIFKR